MIKWLTDPATQSRLDYWGWVALWILAGTLVASLLLDWINRRLK